MKKINLYNLDIDDSSTWVHPITDKSIKESLPFVQEAGNFLCYKDFYTECQGLKSYLIKYTIQGEGCLDYHATESHVRPGQLFWIDTMDWQRYYTSDKSRYWNVIWIHFDGPSVKKLYNLFLSHNNGNSTVTMPEKNKIVIKIQRIIDMILRKQTIKFNLYDNLEYGQIIHSLLYEILISTINSCEPSSTPAIIRDACQFLSLNFHENISLDFLANQYNVNKFYFHKLFKEFTNTTTHSYLTNCRINAAKELLRTTTLSVTDIAFKIGYNSPSHFISVFKKNESFTPGVYREISRKESKYKR